MYKIILTNQFKKSVKKCRKRGLRMDLLKDVIDTLIEKGTLPPVYKPHKLSGEHAGKWECHIQPDWLLVWEQKDDELILLLLDTGTHSDLFK